MEVRKADVAECAAQFVAQLKPQTAATVLGFRGDLGAGKTTFTKAVASALGITDVVTSPTFVIMKHYETSHQEFTHLTHIDAYRLESGDDLSPLKFTELLNDPRRLIVVEWPERVVSALPSTTRYVDFRVVDEDTRDIDFHE